MSELFPGSFSEVLRSVFVCLIHLCFFFGGGKTSISPKYLIPEKPLQGPKVQNTKKPKNQNACISMDDPQWFFTEFHLQPKGFKVKLYVMAGQPTPPNVTPPEIRPY